MRMTTAFVGALLVAAGPVSAQSHAQHHPAGNQPHAAIGNQGCPQMQQMQQMSGSMQQMMQMHQQMMAQMQQMMQMMQQQHQGMGMAMPKGPPAPDANQPH